MKKPPRKYQPYPSDVSDEEWSFVAPYLALNRVDSENRRHDLRAVFNALHWLVRSGASWRMMPHEFPPWPAVYQQMRRWLDAGCFEAMVNDLRVLLRLHAGRGAQPSAMILDSRTLQSSPESGARAGYQALGLMPCGSEGCSAEERGWLTHPMRGRKIQRPSSRAPLLCSPA